MNTIMYINDTINNLFSLQWNALNKTTYDHKKVIVFISGHINRVFFQIDGYMSFCIGQ